MNTTRKQSLRPLEGGQGKSTKKKCYVSAYSIKSIEFRKDHNNSRNIASYKKEADRNIREQMGETPIVSLNKDILITKPVNQWMDEAQSMAIPNMLFGELWFENEICILFSSANVGKSILSVQIADSISSGKPIHPLRMDCHDKTVIYFDFELSAKQFENRYSNDYTNPYRFSEDFFRVEINHEADIPAKDDFNDIINKQIEKEIISTGATIVIVDNITYLKSETEKSKDAIPLMKHLKKIKAKYGLSILALAHSPKRDSTMQINRNHLGGSMMLMNFCDSCFAIGESSRDKNFRYIKQLKVRNTSLIYDTENVLLYEIQKPDNNVHFNFNEYTSESYHLATASAQEKEDRNSQLLELKNQGLSNRKIATELGISEGTVRNILKKSSA